LVVIAGFEIPLILSSGIIFPIFPLNFRAWMAGVACKLLPAKLGLVLLDWIASVKQFFAIEP